MLKMDIYLFLDILSDRVIKCDRYLELKAIRSGVIFIKR